MPARSRGHSLRRAIVWLVERVTFHRVRGQHTLYCPPSLRWWWVAGKWSHRYGHGGWVFLDLAWWRRHRPGGDVDQERDRARRKTEWRDRTRRMAKEGGEKTDGE